jgi:hypothetical protein
VGRAPGGAACSRKSVVAERGEEILGALYDYAEMIAPERN